MKEDPWIGRTIDGRYRVVRPLGDGGMGSVYEAEHLALGKRVALKVILPELVSDEETRARFEREARATATIEHPHVAAGMDFGRLPDGGAYLVVQLVNGVSLRKRLEEGAMSWREACAIGAQIADALAAIHARGFIHRDLTGENVLLTKNEDGSPFVHVLDLGIAGFVDARSEQKLTAEGHVVGTPGYMPPEQALGKPTDERADLYSLGVLLWEMCSGKSLYGARELTQVLALQLTDVPPKIPQLATATAPVELAQLIERLLAREPDDRPKDAVTVRDALRRFAKLSSVVPLVQRFGLPALGVTIAGGVATMGCVLTIGLAVWLVSDDGSDLVKAPSETTAAAPVDVAPTETEEDSLPAPMRAAIDRMVESRYRHQRRAAAEQLHEMPGLPPWARAIADLELGRSCADRRDALERMAEDPRPEALTAITRWHENRTGCGRGRQSDCYTCIREDIDRAYAAISEN